jgi:predicted RNase H-like nuclease
VRFLGVDLAWGEGTTAKRAADTGVVALEESGRIVAAGWTVGIEPTLSWIAEHAVEDTLLFVDAPLVVENEDGQRVCELHVAQRYMYPWKVGANSTNLRKPSLGGVTLRIGLEQRGWLYSDGRFGPPVTGRVVSECYPYTTLVGVPELGYDIRPTYKRKPRGVLTAEWRRLRATVCDDLIRRMASFAGADPPLDLRSHDATRLLLAQPSPVGDAAYKRREDLIDAALCAWTAAYWWRHAHSRSQVLGVTANADPGVPLATIIAPARTEQRR